MTHRLKELDALRGLAAVAVALSHFLLHFQGIYGFRNAPEWVLRSNDAQVLFSGLLPVAFFFMISGFVIYMTVKRCEGWLDFAASRITRLYPAYWAAVILIILVRLFDPAGLEIEAPTIAQSFWNLSMFQELVGVGHLNPVYWSLTYELRFYIFIALIVFSPLRKYFDQIMIAWLIIAVCGFIFEMPNNGLLGLLATFFNAEYAHFFLAGIAFYKYWSDEKSRTVLMMIAGTSVIVFLQWPIWPALIAFSFWGVFALGLMGRLRFLTAKPLVWLGSISYALYLVHLPIGYSIEYFLNQYELPALVIASIALAGSVIGAAAITHLLEKPMMTWQRQKYRSWKEKKKRKTLPAQSDREEHSVVRA